MKRTQDIPPGPEGIQNDHEESHVLKTLIVPWTAVLVVFNSGIANFAQVPFSKLENGSSYTG